jgi:hypothetical protein
VFSDEWPWIYWQWIYPHNIEQIHYCHFWQVITYSALCLSVCKVIASLCIHDNATNNIFCMLSRVKTIWLKDITSQFKFNQIYFIKPVHQQFKGSMRTLLNWNQFMLLLHLHLHVSHLADALVVDGNTILCSLWALLT